jgi:aconitate hydratase
LTFSNPSDYDRVQESDRLSLIDLDKLQQGKPVKCVITHADGSKEEISLSHSYNTAQIEWFREGSALNVLRSKK